MSLKSKNKDRHFSFASLIRLIIFSLVVFSLINYFSTNSNNSVLGGQTINLSPYWQKVVGILPDKNVKDLNDKISNIASQSAEFPQKQIKEIQKIIIKDIYDKINKSIDSNL